MPTARAPVIPEQSGITLLEKKKSGVVNFQLGSAKGVFAFLLRPSHRGEQASVLPAVSPGKWKLG